MDKGQYCGSTVAAPSFACDSFPFLIFYMSSHLGRIYLPVKLSPSPPLFLSLISLPPSPFLFYSAAMSFSQLPHDVIHSILVPAVQIRGLRRGLRLRHVSRAWNVAVEKAVFDSGMIKFSTFIIRGGVDVAFLTRYFAHTVLRDTRCRPPHLALTRQLAERIIEMREQEVDESQARKMLEECVEQIALGTTVFDGQTQFKQTPEHKLLTRFDGNFQLALLAATACTGDLDVARRIPLPRSNDTITKATGYSTETADTSQEPDRCAPIYIDPYAAAAYRGDTEFISYLLESEAEISNQRQSCRATIIEYAAWGGHLDLVNLALGPSFDTSSPDFEGLRESLVSALMRTSRVDIFKRCFELVKDHLQYPQPPEATHTRKCLSGSLARAAGRGDIELMEYLVELGASLDGNQCVVLDESIPPATVAAMTTAAVRGQEDVVNWLLERKAAMDYALVMAVDHGPYSITQLLLENGAICSADDITVKLALVTAILGEDEALFRLLVAYGAKIENYALVRIMRALETDQLESMKKLLEEYSDETAVHLGAEVRRVSRKLLEPVKSMARSWFRRREGWRSLD
ncbi:ankyrin [Nemania serpens]|nr:ankyrin [Nemania serpens]